MFDDDDDDDDDDEVDSQRKGKKHVHYFPLKFTFNNLCIIYTISASASWGELSHKGPLEQGSIFIFYQSRQPGK